MKIKAVILSGVNKPLIVDYIETTPLKKGQVLVKILTSGLCGAQLQEIKGLKNNAKFMPHLIGHEGCGIVEEIGEDVTRLKIGDKVIMHWKPTDGIESDFPVYIYKDKKMSSGKVTTLSEYSIVSENRLTVVNSKTDNELAALIGCAFSTSFGIVQNEIGYSVGQHILILGCGGIGLSLAQFINISNGNIIDGVEKNIFQQKNKPQIAKNCGFTTIHTDIPQSNSYKYNIIIDTTGSGKLISKCFDVIADKGKIILVSQLKKEEKIEIINPIAWFPPNGITIKTTQGGNFCPTKDIPTILNLYKQHIINTGIISHRFKLEQINEAVEILKSGDCGRIVFYPN